MNKEEEGPLARAEGEVSDWLMENTPVYREVVGVDTGTRVSPPPTSMLSDPCDSPKATPLYFCSVDLSSGGEAPHPRSFFRLPPLSLSTRSKKGWSLPSLHSQFPSVWE